MGAREAGDADRLRTPTALLRWLLVVAEVALLGTVLAVNLLEGTPRTIVVGVVATAATVLLVRVARIEARVTSSAVRVRNPFRTVELTWDHVARADWIARGAAGHGLRVLGSDARVRLTLRDGRYVTLTSTAVFKPSSAADITVALRRTAGAAGVVVEPLHQEGPPARHG